MNAQSETAQSETNARSVATVPTEKASRYLQQLGKHFAHKLPVECTPEAGRISFPMGECRMQASDSELRLDLESADADSLAQLEDVVERHLVRFAFREEMTLDWQRQ